MYTRVGLVVAVLIGSTGCVPEMAGPDQPIDSCMGSGDIDVYSDGDLAAFAGATCVGGHLFMHSTSITDLAPLDDVEIIKGHLSFIGNQQLDGLNGLPALLTVEQGVYVQSHENIVHLDGLPALESVGTDPVQSRISIERNLALRRIGGFQSLVDIPAGLRIGNNPALEGITGFGQTTTIGGYLVIMDNPSLTNLDGFAALEYVDGVLEIVGNSSLPTCAAEQLRDRLQGLNEVIILNNDDSGTCP